jgi:hypothetical protein
MGTWKIDFRLELTNAKTPAWHCTTTLDQPGRVVLERCAEKSATEKWENGEMGAILSTFEKFMVMNFSKVDKTAPISRFFIISRGQSLGTALYQPRTVQASLAHNPHQDWTR